MNGTYSFDQRRMAYLKTKAGPADKVAITLAVLSALTVLLPLMIFIDNVIIVKIIGTILAVIVYAVVYGKISRPIFKCYYKKNLEENS